MWREYAKFWPVSSIWESQHAWWVSNMCRELKPTGFGHFWERQKPKTPTWPKSWSSCISVHIGHCISIRRCLATRRRLVCSRDSCLPNTQHRLIAIKNHSPSFRWSRQYYRHKDWTLHTFFNWIALRIHQLLLWDRHVNLKRYVQCLMKVRTSQTRCKGSFVSCFQTASLVK